MRRIPDMKLTQIILSVNPMYSCIFVWHTSGAFLPTYACLVVPCKPRQSFRMVLEQLKRHPPSLRIRLQCALHIASRLRSLPDPACSRFVRPCSPGSRCSPQACCLWGIDWRRPARRQRSQSSRASRRLGWWLCVVLKTFCRCAVVC